MNHYKIQYRPVQLAHNGDVNAFLTHDFCESSINLVIKRLDKNLWPMYEVIVEAEDEIIAIVSGISLIKDYIKTHEAVPVWRIAYFAGNKRCAEKYEIQLVKLSDDMAELNEVFSYSNDTEGKVYFIYVEDRGSLLQTLAKGFVELEKQGLGIRLVKERS